MSMNRELFFRIYLEELTPWQTRILNRCLKGMSPDEILLDKTVWFSYKTYPKLDIEEEFGRSLSDLEKKKESLIQQVNILNSQNNQFFSKEINKTNRELKKKEYLRDKIKRVKEDLKLIEKDLKLIEKEKKKEKIYQYKLSEVKELLRDCIELEKINNFQLIKEIIEKKNKDNNEILKNYKSKISHCKLEIIKKFDVDKGKSTTNENFKKVVKLCDQFIPNQVSIPYEHRQVYGLSKKTPQSPGSPVPLGSAFYIERFDIDSKVLNLVNNPEDNCILVKIKGPSLIGKTSLKIRVLKDKKLVVDIDLAVDVDLPISYEDSNLECFYKSLCRQIAKKLCEQLEQDNIQDELKLDYILDKLDTSWDSGLTPNNNFTEFLHDYILPFLDEPLFLSLDNFDKVFEYQGIKTNFMGLLRSWHERANQYQDSIWRKLALILTYSTDDYLKNESPLANVGEDVQLRDFYKQEIVALFDKWDLALDYKPEDIDKLMSMVGGHPYLVRLAMYHIQFNNQTLDDILNDATTNTGIYSKHLNQIFSLIQKSHDKKLNDLKKSGEKPSRASDKIITIKDALKKIVNSEDYINLDDYNCDNSASLVFQLSSKGLILEERDRIKPRCELYRNYFANKLKSYKIGQDIE